MQVAYYLKMKKDESPRRARRRVRLGELISEVGSATQLANESGTPKSHVSAMLSGARGLGDAMAEKFEMLYAKPPGWFDQPALAEGSQAPAPATQTSAPAPTEGAAPNYLSLDRLFNLLPNDPLVRAVVFQRASAVILDVINGMTGTTPEPVHTEMSQKSDA